MHQSNTTPFILQSSWSILCICGGWTKRGVVVKRAVESISGRQFSNRIDLNAIVARRHTGTLDQNSFQSTNNPAQGIAGILKEAKTHEKCDNPPVDLHWFFEISSVTG